ncbi:hypothetical protein D3C81_1647920 [compost metagenome]
MSDFFLNIVVDSLSARFRNCFLTRRVNRLFYLPITVSIERSTRRLTIDAFITHLNCQKALFNKIIKLPVIIIFD